MTPVADCSPGTRVSRRCVVVMVVGKFILLGRIFLLLNEDSGRHANSHKNSLESYIGLWKASFCSEFSMLLRSLKTHNALRNIGSLCPPC